MTPPAMAPTGAFFFVFDVDAGKFEVIGAAAELDIEVESGTRELEPSKVELRKGENMRRTYTPRNQNKPPFRVVFPSQNRVDRLIMSCFGTPEIRSKKMKNFRVPTRPTGHRRFVPEMH